MRMRKSTLMLALKYAKPSARGRPPFVSVIAFTPTIFFLILGHDLTSTFSPRLQERNPTLQVFTFDGEIYFSTAGCSTVVSGPIPNCDSSDIEPLDSSNA